MSRKGFAKPVLIAIFAGIVLLGVGAYMVFRKAEIPPLGAGTSTPAVPSAPGMPPLSPAPAVPQTQPAAKSYENAEYGFTVEYPLTLSSFEDFFTIEKPIPHLYSCRIYDKSHDSYRTEKQFGPSAAPEDECARVMPPPTFGDFVAEYRKSYFPDAREVRQIRTADDTPAYFIHRVIPNYNITTGETSESHSYYVVLEFDPIGKQANRALQVALGPASTTSCPNGVCEAGETRAACPADCPQDWDWGKIVTDVFAAFRFSR